VVIANNTNHFFDLSRIASIGAFFTSYGYDIHWGVFKHLRKEVKANGVILIIRFVLDLIGINCFFMD